MTNQTVQKIIVEILQKALTGELKEFSKINPAFIAQAITDKVDFESSYTENQAKKSTDAVSYMKEYAMSIINEMSDQLKELEEEEKLLSNFIKGRITSCEFMLDKIDKLC